MWRRTFGALVIAAALAWPGAGAAVSGPGVVIGLVYNKTGPQAALDKPSSRGARLAITQADARGGIFGHPVRWVSADGASDPATLRRVTEALIRDNPSIGVLIGLSDTDMVLAAATVAARNGRVFVTSGATSPRLPAEVPGDLFLACFGDNVQAAAAAEWAHKALSARSAAILYNGSMTYSRLLQGYFRTRFEQLGGRVLAARRYTLDGLAAAAAGVPKADMVYLAAGPEEAAPLAELLRSAGVTAPIVGGDGLDLVKAWRRHPNLGDIYFTTHAYLGADNPDPAMAAFRKAYIAAYPWTTPDAFAALGYDAARLVMAAISAAGSADPKAIRTALAATTGFHGLTGTISYAGGSAIPRKSVTIERIDHGVRHFVRQMMPASVPPP